MKLWRLLIAVLVAVSCTVKEDRGFCPAWCVVYSDGYMAEGCCGEFICNVATLGKGILEYGAKDFDSFEKKGELVLEVPRNEQVYVDVLCGVKEMELNGSVLAIPMGFGCDSIYAGHGSVFIPGEEGETALPLNKDFAVLSIKVKGDVPAGEYPFSFRIIGNVDGYELPGGTPHAGSFDYSPVEEEGLSFRAVIPRQMDDSLMLEIYHKDDASLLTRLNLGELVRDKGYDWTLPDLRDMALSVDLSEAGFNVEVGEWEISETVSIIL